MNLRWAERREQGNRVAVQVGADGSRVKGSWQWGWRATDQFCRQSWDSSAKGKDFLTRLVTEEETEATVVKWQNALALWHRNNPRSPDPLCHDGLSSYSGVSCCSGLGYQREDYKGMLHIKKGGTGLLLEVMGIFIALAVVLISQLYAIVLNASNCMH